MLTKTDIQALNLSPTKRDFVQIWNELLETAGKLSSRWDPTSTNESDPGIVLLKALTGIADKLNYTIDKNILEAFLPTAAQEESIRKLCDMLGYSVKYYQSAKTAVTIKYHNPDEEDSGEEVDIMTAGKILPKFTVLSDANQECNYFTLEAVNFSTRQTSNTVSCMEGQLVKCESLNDNNVITVNQISDDNKFYLPEVQIAENGIFVYNVFAGGNLTNGGLVDGAAWEKVDNLNAKQRGSRIYKFGFDSYEGRPYLEFPDDYSSLFDDGLFIYYTRTSGSAGNISVHTLTQLELPSVDGWNKISADHFSVSNASAATNGADIETIEQAYKNFKKTIGTFDTLVTCRDYMNKIYSMIEDSTDVKMLSNILVTDIRDDINRAITICSCDDAGIFYKERALTADTNIIVETPKPVFNADTNSWHLGSVDGIQLTEDQLISAEPPGDYLNVQPQPGAPGFDMTLPGIVDFTYNYANVDDYNSYYYTIEQHGYIYYTRLKARALQKNTKALIDHFDLILYPYKAYNQVKAGATDIAATFNNSFMYANKGKAIIAKLDYEQLKHSAHNLTTPSTGDLLSINNYVKLDATIATNERVTPIEGNEILNNIKIALANAFNMQELDFGEEIPFESLVSVIEGADARIRVCSLNDPTLYTTFSVLGPKDASQNYDVYEYAVASKYISTKVGEADEKLSYEVIDPALNNNTRKVSTFDTKIARQIYNKLVLRNVLAGRVPLFDYNKTFVASSAESPYQATTIHVNNPKIGLLEVPTADNPFTMYIDENGVMYTGQYVGQAVQPTSYEAAILEAEAAAAELAALSNPANAASNAGVDTTGTGTDSGDAGADSGASTTTLGASNNPADATGSLTGGIDQSRIFGEAAKEAASNSESAPGQAAGLKLLAAGVGGQEFAKKLDDVNNAEVLYTVSQPPFATKETVILENIPGNIPLEEPSAYKPVTTYVDGDGSLYTGTYDAVTGTTTYTKTQTSASVQSSLLGANASTKNTNNADDSIDSNIPITSMAGYCELPATESIVSNVVLSENEVVHFRSPNLLTVKTFPAYVNYHLKLNDPIQSKTTTGTISNVVGQTNAEFAEATSLFELLNANDGAGWGNVLTYFKSAEGGSGKYVRTIKMTQKVSKCTTGLVTADEDCSENSSTGKHELDSKTATCKHCGAPMATEEYNEDTGISLGDVDQTGATLRAMQELIKKSGCIKLINSTPTVAWDTSAGDIAPTGVNPPAIPLTIDSPYFTHERSEQLATLPETINAHIAAMLSKDEVELPKDCPWTMTFEFECVPLEPASLDAWIDYFRNSKNGKIQNGSAQFNGKLPIEEAGTILWRTYGEGYAPGKYILDSTKKLMPFGTGYFGLLPDAYFTGIYLATSLGTNLVPKMIKSGDVHELQRGEYLLIEYTQAATETNSDPAPVTEVYYGDGTNAIILKPTGFAAGLQDTEAALKAGAVSIKDDVVFLNPADQSIIKQNNGANPVLLSIGANEQIEMQELSRVSLDRSTFNSFVYVYKNFDNELLEKIPLQAPGQVAKRSYTLKPNEYIFYTDCDKTEFAYYTSGTEVILEGNAKIPKCKVIDIGSVLDGGVDLVPWQYCSLAGADKIIFQEYQYITLTAGDKINNISLPGTTNNTTNTTGNPTGDTTGTAGSTSTPATGNANTANNTKIDSNWQVCDNVSYTALGDIVQDSSSVDIPAETTLPSLNLLERAGNGWEVKSELLLTASPSLSQTLRSTDKVKTGLRLMKTPTNGLQPITLDISADSLLGSNQEDAALVEAAKARDCLTNPTEFWSARSDSTKALEFKTNFDCALNGQLGGSTDSITLADAKRMGMDKAEPSFQLKLFSPEMPALIRTAPGKVTPQILNNKVHRAEEILDTKLYGDIWQAANLSSIRVGQIDESDQEFDGALKLSVSILPDTYGILSIYVKYNSTKSEQVANTWLEFIPGIDASTISVLNRPEVQQRWEQEIAQANEINSSQATVTKVAPRLKLQPGLNCIKFKQSCYLFVKTSNITDGTLLFDDLRLVNTEKVEYKLANAETPIQVYTNGLNLDQISYLSYPDEGDPSENANITMAAAKELKMSVVDSTKKALLDIATEASAEYRQTLNTFNYYKPRIQSVQTAENALIEDLTNLCQLLGVSSTATDKDQVLGRQGSLKSTDIDTDIAATNSDVLKYLWTLSRTLEKEQTLLDYIDASSDMSTKLQNVLDNVSKYHYEPNVEVQVRDVIEQIRVQLKNKIAALTPVDCSELFRSICSDQPRDNLLKNSEIFALDATTGFPQDWRVSGVITSDQKPCVSRKYDPTANQGYALCVSRHGKDTIQPTYLRQSFKVTPLTEYSVIARVKTSRTNRKFASDHPASGLNKACLITISGIANAKSAATASGASPKSSLSFYEDCRPANYAGGANLTIGDVVRKNTDNGSIYVAVNQDSQFPTAMKVLIDKTSLSDTGEAGSAADQARLLFEPYPNYLDTDKYRVSMIIDAGAQKIEDWYTVRMNFTSIGSKAQIKLDLYDAEIDYIKILPKALCDLIYGDQYPIEDIVPVPVDGYITEDDDDAADNRIISSISAFNANIFRQRREDFIKHVYTSANSSLQALLQEAIDNVNAEASKETASKLSDLAASMYLTDDRKSAVTLLKQHLEQMQTWLQTGDLDELMSDIGDAISKGDSHTAALLLPQVKSMLKQPAAGASIVARLLELLKSESSTINTAILEQLWLLDQVLGTENTLLNQFDSQFKKSSLTTPTVTSVMNKLAEVQDNLGESTAVTSFNELQTLITSYITSWQTYTMGLITAILNDDTTEPMDLTSQLDALLANIAENENDALRETVHRVKEALEHQNLIRQALYTNAYTESNWYQLSSLDEFSYVIEAAVPLVPEFLNGLVDIMCNILSPLASEYAELPSGDYSSIATTLADKVQTYYSQCTLCFYDAINKLFNSVDVLDSIRTIKNVYATNAFVRTYKPLAKKFGDKLSVDVLSAIDDVRSAQPNSKIDVMLDNLQELAKSTAIDSTAKQLEMLPLLRAELANAIQLDNQLVDTLIFYNTTKAINEARMASDAFYETFIDWVTSIRNKLLQLPAAALGQNADTQRSSIRANTYQLLYDCLHAQQDSSCTSSTHQAQHHIHHQAIYDIFNNAVPALPPSPTDLRIDGAAEPYKSIVANISTLHGCFNNKSVASPLVSKIMNTTDLTDVVERILKVYVPGTTVIRANTLNDLIVANKETAIEDVIAIVNDAKDEADDWAIGQGEATYPEVTRMCTILNDAKEYLTYIQNNTLNLDQQDDMFKMIKKLEIEQQLLADILAVDIDRDFYYTAAVDPVMVIDLQESYESDDETEDTKRRTSLMNPSTNYDINNINNKFVISKLDIDYLDKGLRIARSSLLN